MIRRDRALEIVADQICQRECDPARTVRAFLFRGWAAGRQRQRLAGHDRGSGHQPGRHHQPRRTSARTPTRTEGIVDTRQRRRRGESVRALQQLQQWTASQCTEMGEGRTRHMRRARSLLLVDRRTSDSHSSWSSSPSPRKCGEQGRRPPSPRNGTASLGPSPPRPSRSQDATGPRLRLSAQG